MFIFDFSRGKINDSEVSLKVIALINEVKKKGVDAEENEGPAGGSEENVSEPFAANVELRLSGSE